MVQAIHELHRTLAFIDMNSELCLPAAQTPINAHESSVNVKKMTVKHAQARNQSDTNQIKESLSIPPVCDI